MTRLLCECSSVKESPNKRREEANASQALLPVEQIVKECGVERLSANYKKYGTPMPDRIDTKENRK